MAERWTSDHPGPTEQGIVLAVGVGDVIAGTIDEAIETMQVSLHLDSEASAGPMHCQFTTFSESRDLFERFLKVCELPAGAIAEYLEGWDSARVPIAVVHWGKPRSIGFRRASLN